MILSEKPNIKLDRAYHQKQEVITISFAYNRPLIEALKSKTRARWSLSKQYWYLPAQSFDLSAFFSELKADASIDYSALQQNASNHSGNLERQAASQAKNALPPLNLQQQASIREFVGWMEQKRYSKNTIKTYAESVGVLLRFYADRSLDQLDKKDVEHFNITYILSNNFSYSYQNQVINAVKLFFSRMQGVKMDIKELERPRRPRRLPKVIDKGLIKQMLQSIPNEKHRFSLGLIYGLGLRRGELLNLKLEDVDLGRQQLTIRNGKGQKDRVLPLSDKQSAMIKSYLQQYAPVRYLVEGQQKGMPYSATSLEKIFHKYFGKVQKSHHFTLHCLRHSFGTHQLEAGVDLRYIQELMGHKSSKTTELYTWVSMKNLRNIKPPTDDFDF